MKIRHQLVFFFGKNQETKGNEIFTKKNSKKLEITILNSGVFNFFELKRPKMTKNNFSQNNYGCFFEKV